jgi:hypothetical protein
MSIFPSGVFSLGCDLLGGLGVPPGAIGARGGAGEAAGDLAGGGFWLGVKKLKEDGFTARTFNRPMLTPHAPIFSCLAWFSSCRSFSNSTREFLNPGGTALYP